VAIERHLEWDGCFNVRELGGFPAANGRETRWGEIVRSDSPARLSPRGWAALRRHGIGTIVDLREAEERDADEPRDGGIARFETPVFDYADRAFWDAWRHRHDPAAFYLAALERWPRRFGDALRTIARAGPGGVLVHCQVGRDRTGLVSGLLLALVGVPDEAIAADFSLSAERLEPLYRRLIRDEQEPRVRERLSRENVSEAASMLTVLAALDLPAYLEAAGLTEAETSALRERLVGESAAPG